MNMMISYQELVRTFLSEFNSNLLELLKYLHQVSPAVTEHIITISNETFLSTLFHLTDKPIDALNLRADMLFWYGEITKDERFKDRAKEGANKFLI
ncbi:hypothetical protein [Enterobacter asburiae]|uniref:hypothetical protein n=1 Tax=Enterobacter asburiae TaxID=61645 RepID=UPI003CF12867